MINIAKDLELENKLAKLLATKHYEGDVLPYPYLDSNGFMTIGAGHILKKSNIPDAILKHKFMAIPWKAHVSGSGQLRPATQDEKEHVFNALSSAMKTKNNGKDFDRPANTYVSLKGPLNLPAYIGENYLRDDIKYHIADVRKAVGDEAFDRLPINQQQVLVDISFNVGHLDKFPHLRDAAQKGDTDAMAKQLLVHTNQGPNGQPPEKFERNWDRIISNYAMLVGKSESEAIHDLAVQIKDRQDKEASLDPRIKAAIDKFPSGPSSSNDAAGCQGRVNVLGYTRGDGIAVSDYSRSCLG
jgi:GH24 family phage-related lysozyme (muramidase)